MARKKILYIHHGKGLGGAPLSLLYLVQGLDRKKYDPVVLFLYDSEIIDLYKSKGIRVVGPLNVRDFPHTAVWWYRWYHIHHFCKTLWDTFKTLFFVADNWLEKIKPDLVHLNTSSLIAWGKVAHRRGIPIVWHIREPLSPGYLGLRRWIVQKSVSAYADIIMPICKNDSLPWCGDSRVQIVYNAVNPVLFNSEIIKKAAYGKFLSKHGFADNVPNILFLGGLSYVKGTHIILKVFQKLLRRVANAQLLIAGYVDFNGVRMNCLKYLIPNQRYKRDVLSLIDEVHASVFFLGPIQEVPYAMAASDVVVFPATVGHFARPIIEAGFMRKPVIASNFPPLDELVVNGKTGFLIDPTDYDAWVKVLCTLLSEKERKQEMGDAAYEYCQSHFALNNQIKRIENCYANIFAKQ